MAQIIPAAHLVIVWILVHLAFVSNKFLGKLSLACGHCLAHSSKINTPFTFEIAPSYNGATSNLMAAAFVRRKVLLLEDDSDLRHAYASHLAQKAS